MVAIVYNVGLGCCLPLPLLDIILLQVLRDHKAYFCVIVHRIHASCFVCILCANRYDWVLCMLLVHKSYLFKCEI